MPAFETENYVDKSGFISYNITKKGKVYMVMYYFIRLLSLNIVDKSEENSVFAYNNSVILANAKSKALFFLFKSVQNLNLSK